MKRVFTVLALLAMACQGCAPLNFKIYKTNTTDDAETLMIRSEIGHNAPDTAVRIRAMHQAEKISAKTKSQLNQQLMARPVNNGLELKIPPHTTVFVTDLVNALDRFGNNTLELVQNGHTDSTVFRYP